LPVDFQTVPEIRNARNAVLSFVHLTFPRFSVEVSLQINNLSSFYSGTEKGPA
jgi:hypothetical protein